MASAKALDALGVAGFKAVVSGIVYATGFRAVSDDDFSRVVIAMQFAESPSLDPSGTSWLPLPFWLMGAPMTLFGSSLEVARAVAFVQGIVGTLLLWQAARWLDLSRKKAWLAAAAASAFPYAAWLGVATVPEYLTAALIVLGVVTTRSFEPKRRVAGAVALGLAALCRYEAWFVVAAFAALNLHDALRERRARWLLPAGLALVTPACWMLHGKLTHGSATFFLARVAAYREAVGGSLGSVWHELASYPALVLVREPELAVLTLLSLFVAWRWGKNELLHFKRPALLLGVMMLTLMLGAVLGGAPTHHPERAVLPVWMLAAVVVAASLVTALQSMRPQHYGVARMIVAGAVLCGVLVRYKADSRQQFVTRSAEVELGNEARKLVGDGRLLIGTRDYGFFAVMAGFGAPGRAVPSDTRDPRSPKHSDAFQSLSTLREQVRKERADALIAPSEHAAVATRLGNVQARRGDYLLITALRP